MMKKVVFAVVSICLFYFSPAQNYQAIHGSSFAGSLGIYNNPASGIHSHYNWDVTLLGVQLKSSTNAFSSTQPLMKLPKADVFLSNGDKPRQLHLSQDLHVLNANFKLNQRRSIALGFNTRNYVHVKSKDFNFVDTITSFNSFLQLNRPDALLGGRVVSNAWAEAYVSYSQIIRNTNLDQLSAGITLKAIRGISGVYLQADRVRFTEIMQPGMSPTFVLTDPNGKYGYSSNYDRLLDDRSSPNEAYDFLSYTQGSLGIDMGVEYLLKNDYAPQYDDEVEEFDYNWKIGISILDLGRNFFKHGKYSRQFNGARTNVSEIDIENKFSSPDNIQDFYDSLETVVQQLQSPAAEFYIWQPTRLVINVDKSLHENFFINGELSINFFSTQNGKGIHTRELNFLTVTPRWETALLGVYLPVQFNTQGQLWIGSAFKAGPLLVGIHDIGWLFSNKKAFNGGAYLALVVRNFFSSAKKSKSVKYMECPPLF